MKCLILLCLVAGALAVQNCPANQHYDSCGSACPLTCDNYQNPPKACVLMCVAGCHCDAGYVKNEHGECVKPQQCPSKAESCPANSHYSSCGTACPLTCDNYQNPPDACILMCVAGCHCDAGYVKNEQGKCVKPQQCHSKAEESCPANSHYSSCGTACPLTCYNYQNPPKYCVKMCVAGCHCDKGYVRNGQGQCVRSEQCHAKAESCPANQHYEECGTVCPLTCDNYQNPPKACVKMCKSGCQCDAGYVENGRGDCVKPQQCHSNHGEVCGENEAYNECGTACPLTCANVNNPPRICPAMCKIGCECVEGFVRSADGRCVRPENCPNLGLAVSDVCELPAESGLCLAYLPRYYYNKESGECEKFIYGGCGGNANNFRTVEECESACAQ